MINLNTKAKKVDKPKVAIKKAELVVTDKEISFEEIWQFVQEKAGGNEANVHIVPLSNVDLKGDKPVPFGYGGKVGGVRQLIQDGMLKGIDGDMSLKTILNTFAKKGHSRKKPVCLHALMHGGYCSSSKYWMTPYIKLVVQG